MKPDMYKDMQKMLLVVMILVPAIPFLASLAIGYSSYRASMERSAFHVAERIAEDHAILISSFLDERRIDLESILSTVPVTSLLEQDQLDRVFQSLQRTSKTFIDIGLIDENGVQKSYAGPFDLVGKQYSHQPWFSKTLQSGSYVSDVYLGYRHRPHFTVAVAAGEGKGRWVLRATVDQGLFGDLVQGVSIGETGEAFIVNDAAVLQTIKRSGGTILSVEESSQCLLDQEGVSTGLHGEYICAVAPIKGTLWLLVVRQKTSEAFAEFDWAARTIALVSLAGGIFIVSLAILVSSRVVAILRSKEAERREMENHLLRAARLAELGEMSAGFAHEINNPLQVMKSEIALMEMNAAALKEDQPLEEADKKELQSSLEQVNFQIDRCAAITRSILKFGRYPGPENTAVDLHVYLPEVTLMMQRKAKVSGVDFSLIIPAEIPRVMADPGQLQQVLVNVLNNALQAIEERHGFEGGVLRVSVSRTPPDLVQIEVEDNGSGMSRDVLAKIFNPFFTTKAPGKGTGLGLSVCHAIMDGMGGGITAQSREGKGAVFTMTLPEYSH